MDEDHEPQRENAKNGVKGADQERRLRLIEKVRAARFIYDQSDKDYKRKERKDAWFEATGQELGFGKGDAKKVWKNIQDTYGKIRKRMKGSASGSPAADAVTSWPFYKSLTWLEPFRGQRDGEASSLQMAESHDLSDNSGTDEGASTRRSSLRPEDSASNVVGTPSSSRKRARKSLEERLSKTMDVEKPTTPDEHDLFGAMIAAKIKKLPEYAQSDAQQQVLALVNRIHAQHTRRARR